MSQNINKDSIQPLVGDSTLITPNQEEMVLQLEKSIEEEESNVINDKIHHDPLQKILPEEILEEKKLSKATFINQKGGDEKILPPDIKDDPETNKSNNIGCHKNKQSWDKEGFQTINFR